MPTTADMFTITEAAAELGLTPSALRSAISYGSLRPVRLDRRTNLIAREEVERYRREHLGQRGKRPRTENAPKQQAYQHTYYQRRKAARQQQPDTPEMEARGVECVCVEQPTYLPKPDLASDSTTDQQPH